MASDLAHQQLWHDRLQGACRGDPRASKKHWNSSDSLAWYPLSIAFARRVGMVMTEPGDDPSPNPSYRFYL